MTLDRTSYQGETIGVELPVTVDLMVAETEPGFAGDTADRRAQERHDRDRPRRQRADLRGEGDTIRVDTRTGEYQTRV